MTTKKQYYMERLHTEENLIQFLQDESNLPGPRANLELAQAFSEIADEQVALNLLKYDPGSSPVNDPREFLCFCGVVTLGRLIGQGKTEYFTTLREFASDPRWRIREAVAMALQTIGRKDIFLLIGEMMHWLKGNLYEKRAVAAALCEPDLIDDKINSTQAIKVIQKITLSLIDEEDKKQDEFRVLRQCLGYCWSVVISVNPELGKSYFENLFELDDPDIEWIIKENLKKNRLNKIDSSWVDSLKMKLLLKKVKQDQSSPL